tara:strand:+ start:396 stop:659 length:264 start_codon:yes stop_codon:yes gene_type:complete
MEEQISYTDNEIFGNQHGFMVIRNWSGKWSMNGNSYGHAYSTRWSAQRYGVPIHKDRERHTHSAIMDMKQGKIVWRSWKDSNPYYPQ